MDCLMCELAGVAAERARREPAPRHLPNPGRRDRLGAVTTVRPRNSQHPSMVSRGVALSEPFRPRGVYGATVWPWHSARSRSAANSSRSRTARASRTAGPSSAPRTVNPTSICRMTTSRKRRWWLRPRTSRRTAASRRTCTRASGSATTRSSTQSRRARRTSASTRFAPAYWSASSPTIPPCSS